MICLCLEKKAENYHKIFKNIYSISSFNYMLYFKAGNEIVPNSLFFKEDG